MLSQGKSEAGHTGRVGCRQAAAGPALSQVQPTCVCRAACYLLWLHTAQDANLEVQKPTRLCFIGSIFGQLTTTRLPWDFCKQYFFCRVVGRKMLSNKNSSLSRPGCEVHSPRWSSPKTGTDAMRCVCAVTSDPSMEWLQLPSVLCVPTIQLGMALGRRGPDASLHRWMGCQKEPLFFLWPTCIKMQQS